MADTASLPDHESDFGWALGLLARAYRDTVTPGLGDIPHGSRGYQTLAEVVRGGQPSQVALAKHLGIDRTVMTYLIDDLVDAGLVERSLNPLDRRQRQIVATARGHAAIADLCTQVSDAEHHLLAALDPEERSVLRSLTVKAASALNCAEAGRPPDDQEADPTS